MYRPDWVTSNLQDAAAGKHWLVSRCVCGSVWAWRMFGHAVCCWMWVCTCFGLMLVSHWMSGVLYGVRDAKLEICVVSQQQNCFLVNKMAEHSGEGELTQRCPGVKEQQNGELNAAGKRRRTSNRWYEYTGKVVVVFGVVDLWTSSLLICACTPGPEVPVDERKQRDREERETLVLWKKPLLTLHYFTLELLITFKEWISRWGQRWDASPPTPTV